MRHGQTDWNVAGRFQGRSDVPLNATGREQAERLALGLASTHLDAVYSSPLSRCLETAVAIAQRHGLKVLSDPRLSEIDQGEWEGMLTARIAEAYPELFRRWCEDARSVRPPGGESIREVHDRVVAALEEMAIDYPEANLCVVTHKAAIVTARCHYLGLDLREEMSRMPENASWEMLEVAPGRWRPGSLCCSAVGEEGEGEGPGVPGRNEL